MKDNKIPSPLVSLLPVFVLILLLFVTIRTFGSDALSGGSQVWLSGNFWLVSFKISYLCLPLFHETRTTPSCHPSGCAYRQL